MISNKYSQDHQSIRFEDNFEAVILNPEVDGSFNLY
jgi:hypothetical protein